MFLLGGGSVCGIESLTVYKVEQHEGSPEVKLKHLYCPLQYRSYWSDKTYISKVNRGAKWRCAGWHDQLTGVEKDVIITFTGAAAETWGMKEACLHRWRDLTVWETLWSSDSCKLWERDKKKGYELQMWHYTHMHTMELMTCQGRRNLSLCNRSCCKKLWLVAFGLFTSCLCLCFTAAQAILAQSI